MSVLHYIKTKQDFNFEELTRSITEKYAVVEFEQRATNLCYFWVDGVSTRGIDVSLESENWIELRNTILSNEADYQLTNFIAETICDLFKGNSYKENEDFDEKTDAQDLECLEIKLPLFDADYISSQFQHDVVTLAYMITANESAFGINGPKRQVHLGQTIFNEMSAETWEKQAELVEQIMLKVNYSFPSYEYGNVLQTGEGERAMKLKLITNVGDCIIDKYDFITFQNNKEEQIMLTNKTLNTILPARWHLLDEYTIAAPKLEEKEFLQLIENAEALNEIADFEARMRGEQKIR